ncbi:MAG: hypothetical protein WAS21_08570 [Geminicoccaceae bacterium]
MAAANRDAPQPGVFMISLDFELRWGTRDSIPLDRYRRNVLGARRVIPRMVAAFTASGVHATWATVGFLFFDRKEELLASLPTVLPAYTNRALSPYPDLATLGANEREDPYHFGRSLVREIASHPGQEIGTHTFSHYFCLEEGQTPAAFEADLVAAVSAAQALGLILRSLVFPRNQFNPRYLEICRRLGIITYRGVEKAWPYKQAPTGTEGPTKRLVRLLDSYIDITGDNDFHPERPTAHLPLNLPSSRFLRPTGPGWQLFDRVRLQRILNSMTSAARNGTVFHLWWHPHNFGAQPDANLAFLACILAHYRRLADSYGMLSQNMGELADSMDVTSSVNRRHVA